MTGKPAARMGDAVAYAVIVQGSATVLIGSQSGVASSPCPSSNTVGSPVNPALGAKVLFGQAELDFALPGPLPVAWQRQYSSYVDPRQGPRCGLLGFGWTLPAELRIELTDTACTLFDASGRSIAFEPIGPGAADYSPSENIHLLHGGPSILASGQDHARWAAIPREWLGDSRYLFLTGASRTVWVFGQADDRRFELIHFLDALGRRQTYLRDRDLCLTGLIDGAGRRYRLSYQNVHDGRPELGGWPADSGRRLVGVDLVEPPGDAGSRAIPLVRYQYDGAGDLVGVTDRNGIRVREFAYYNHRLVMHRERGGPEHRYLYENDAPGARVVEQHNQHGISYRFDYRDAESSVVVTDSLGRRECYRFEGEAGLKRLVAHTRADGSAMSYQYDGAGRLVGQVDPLGRTAYWRLDGEGRVVGQQGPDGGQTMYTWDETHNQLLEVRSPAGLASRFEYDAYGRLLTVTAPDGGITRYRYPDPADALVSCDRPLETVDAKGGVKKLQWSNTGQLLAYTDCSGRTTRYRYDMWGHLLDSTDPMGSVTRYEWNALGQLAALVRADGGRETYRYDAAGRLVETCQPDGNLVSLDRDPQGRIVAHRAGGLSLALEYDIAGRLLTLINQNQAATRFSYDVMNRLIEEVGVDGRTQNYRYDAAGQLIEWRDGNIGDARTTRYAYDAAGRLVEQRIDSTQYGPGVRQRYRFNADGQLLAAEVDALAEDHPDAEPAPKYSSVAIARDAAGLPVAETQTLYRDGAIEFQYTSAHRYDALGNRIASELPGLGELNWLTYGSGHIHGLTLDRQPLLDFERDAAHREIERRYGNGLIEQRQLDPLGRLLGQHVPGLAADPELQRRRYRYDALGQLVEAHAGDRATAYRYDPSRRLVAMAGADGERQWRFDPAGNRLPDPTAELAGRQLPEWRERVRANLDNPDFNFLEPDPTHTKAEVAEVRQWRDNRIGHSAGTVYHYDVWGNRRLARRPDGSELRFDYDGLHRLIRVVTFQADVGESGRAEYRYDAFGRRLAKTVNRNGETRTIWYGWDGDRLEHREDERTIRHTVYEPRSFAPMLELSRAKGGGGALEALASAALDEPMAEALRAMFGQMPEAMRKSLETQLAEAAHNGLPAQSRSVLPEDFDPGPTEAALAAMRDVLDKGGETAIEIRYYHCDHLGTPIALSDARGEIVWRANYDPWGQLLAEQGEIDQPIRFQGQQYDPETGLHYNRHRYYDPQLGTYITQDPIGLHGDLNFYLYVSGNPLNAVDRLGLFGDGTYAGPEKNPNGPLGHSDFYGQKEFGLDFTKEDHGWSSPFNPLSSGRHFRPLEQSEGEANDAIYGNAEKGIKPCSKEAFERAMHRVQDFYSHYNKGYRWEPFNFSLRCWGFGHICDDTKPDEDMDAWGEANEKTKEMVGKWRSCCS